MDETQEVKYRYKWKSAKNVLKWINTKIVFLKKDQCKKYMCVKE